MINYLKHEHPLSRPQNVADTAIGTSLAKLYFFPLLQTDYFGACRLSAIAIDHDRISRLFIHHREAIIAFLMHRVRCPETAQDLSQEAFIRLLRQETVAHADNLTGYLFRTAERLAIDFLRHHQRTTLNAVALDEDLLCPNIQPEPLTILRQQCEILLDAIASLPKQCRQVFLLRKIDELGYAEIAAQLAISEKTVQRHLVKAMLHCHRRLHDPLFKPHE